LALNFELPNKSAYPNSKSAMIEPSLHHCSTRLCETTLQCSCQRQHTFIQRINVKPLMHCMRWYEANIKRFLMLS